MNINVWHGSVDRYVATLIWGLIHHLSVKYPNILMDCYEHF